MQMKANFKIISFIEIEYNGIEYDLHNNFDFQPQQLQISEQQIILHFKKSKGNWAENVACRDIYFVLENYSFLKEIAPKSEYREDDFCLSGITYFDSDFREENYGLLQREYPNENDDIIFSFESERVIRVNCETITYRII